MLVVVFLSVLGRGRFSFQKRKPIYLYLDLEKARPDTHGFPPSPLMMRSPGHLWSWVKAFSFILVSVSTRVLSDSVYILLQLMSV